MDRTFERIDQEWPEGGSIGVAEEKIVAGFERFERLLG
jgi:hypothetical protein